MTALAGIVRILGELGFRQPLVNLNHAGTDGEGQDSPEPRMPSSSPTREDQLAILAQSKRFRDFLIKAGVRRSRRSGIRRAADLVCDELG